MTDIPHRPFDKIAVDLFSDFFLSTSGNQHILNVIDHLTGWSEAFSISDKKADTIVPVFTNNYKHIHMCPLFILLNNWTEFKIQSMNNVFKQLGIDGIFSAPYHP